MKIDKFFQTIQAVVHSGFTRLAPALTPLAPAVVFAIASGLGVYKMTGGVMPEWTAVSLAVIVGIASALGLEAAGYKSFGSAVRAFQAGMGAWSFVLPVSYMLIGITVVWFIHWDDPDLAVLSTSMFLLSGAVYASRMVSEHVKRVETAVAQEKAQETAVQDDQTAFDRQQQQDQLQWERDQKALADQRKHEEKLAGIEARARVKIETAVASQQQPAAASSQPAASQQLASSSQQQPAAASSQPAASQDLMTCDYCDDPTLRSRAGTNAHYRYCDRYQLAKSQKLKSAQNGQHKEGMKA